jgi:hypothetical protein
MRLGFVVKMNNRLISSKISKECDKPRCVTLTHGLWLTPWRGVLLENPIVAQLVTKFSIFYGTRKFNIVFMRTRHWYIFWASWIQSSPHFFKIHFNIIPQSVPVIRSFVNAVWTRPIYSFSFTLFSFHGTYHLGRNRYATLTDVDVGLLGSKAAWFCK